MPPETAPAPTDPVVPAPAVAEPAATPTAPAGPPVAKVPTVSPIEKIDASGYENDLQAILQAAKKAPEEAKAPTVGEKSPLDLIREQAEQFEAEARGLAPAPKPEEVPVPTLEVAKVDPTPKPAEIDDDDAPADGKVPQIRFRPEPGLDATALVLLRANPTWGIEKATAAAKAALGIATPTAAVPQPAQTAPQPPATSSEAIAAQIDELENLKADAEEITNGPEIARLSREIRAKQKELQSTEAQESAYHQHAIQAHAAASDKAIGMYPTLGEAGSPMETAYMERYQYLQSIGHPILDNPQFPVLIANAISAEQGILPVAPGSKPAAAVTAPAPAKPAAQNPAPPATPPRPVPAPVGRGSTSTAAADPNLAFIASLPNTPEGYAALEAALLRQPKQGR